MIPMSIPTNNPRLLSLDFMRGLIMVFLMLEGAGLYDSLLEVAKDTPFEFLIVQFSHHPWNGLRFWDLIQPGFMFMAGTAMAYSLHRQQVNGMAWSESFLKVLRRSGWLFFFGVLNYAVRPGGLSFELWNVLTQLSFTTLIAFLIFRWPFLHQLIFSFGLLALTEILYRWTNVPGFDQPFTDQHNFGNYVDLLLMNKINDDGWVAINCIPTAAHTIWGVLAGKLLLSARPENQKIKWLALFGVAGLILGYTMNFTMTPIIKRIATSSFTIASGGWCLLGLALFYGWIDIKNHKQKLHFFTVVGMNSIFIYLFMGIVGGRWLDSYIAAITNGLMGMISVPQAGMAIVTSLAVFALDWSLCLFLYRKGIFFKL